jgi:hypothetical protein
MRLGHRNAMITLDTFHVLHEHDHQLAQAKSPARGQT